MPSFATSFARALKFSVLAWICATACQSSPTRPHASIAPETPEPLPDPVLAPVNRNRGEVLQATVPLIDGSGLVLSDLRGRVVVLELTGTWTDRWQPSFSVYNDLLRRHGDRLAVIVIALDPDRNSLSPEPMLRQQGFELGWDPQGALAAQLQVAALPTVIILDQTGAISFVRGAATQDADRDVDATVRDLLSGGAMAPSG